LENDFIYHKEEKYNLNRRLYLQT